RLTGRGDVPEPLRGQDVPMMLRADRDPGPSRRVALPLFERCEGELPLVRRDLRLVPQAVRIEPRVLPANGHPRVRLSLELLDVVVRHRRSPFRFLAT